jgi:hypothetical protein
MLSCPFLSPRVKRWNKAPRQTTRRERKDSRSEHPGRVEILVLGIVHQVHAVQEIIGAPEISARKAGATINGGDVERGIALALKMRRPYIA